VDLLDDDNGVLGHFQPQIGLLVALDYRHQLRNDVGGNDNGDSDGAGDSDHNDDDDNDINNADVDDDGDDDDDDNDDDASTLLHWS
jgi:hypothetical protein